MTVFRLETSQNRSIKMTNNISKMDGLFHCQRVKMTTVNANRRQNQSSNLRVIKLQGLNTKKLKRHENRQLIE